MFIMLYSVMNMLYFSYLLSIMYICTFMRINIVIVIVIVIAFSCHNRKYYESRTFEKDHAKKQQRSSVFANDIKRLYVLFVYSMNKH